MQVLVGVPGSICNKRVKGFMGEAKGLEVVSRKGAPSRGTGSTTPMSGIHPE